MTNERHRQGELEGHRHRAVALFAAIQCWTRGLDGVVFKKPELLRVLGLQKRIKLSSRLKWLKEDFSEYFDHVQEVYLAGKTNVIGELNSVDSLWVSRRPFPDDFWNYGMTTDERLARLPVAGPRIAPFEMWAETHNNKNSVFGGDDADEKMLVSYLSLLSHGLVSPRSIPCLLDKESVLMEEIRAHLSRSKL